MAALQRLLSIALVVVCCGGASTNAVVGTSGLVDDTRLVAAPGDARNWITAGGRYDNARFSGLAQIDTKSVGELAPRWSFHTGKHGGFETTPLVVDGTMYLTTPFDDVVALDATNGAVRWRYHHVLRHKPCCGPANRGAAVAYGRVYIATVDARLVALDQTTGALLWDTPLANDPQGKVESRADLGLGDTQRGQAVTGETGIFANMAPLAVDGKIVVGVTGVGYGLHLGSEDRKDAHTSAVVGFAGDYGHRGFYAAFDAATGKLDWRWYTIPDRGWEGTFRADTPDGVALGRDIAAEKAAMPAYKDAWKTGGGSAWTTPAFDPALGLLYVGVGNPSPQFADQTRPGDNRDTVSLVALDAATGKPRWAYQEVPHDVWGYDVASPAVLFDTIVDGQPVPAVAQAGKTGWLYVIDRRTGKLLMKSEPFVTQHNLFAQPTAAGIEILPSAFGGASWSPVAYDASSTLAFVAGINAPMTYRLHGSDRSSKEAVYTEAVAGPETDRSGTLSAIDTRSGKIRWQAHTMQPLIGGVLATAGGLVFTGEGNGNFDAFEAATGTRLWQANCGAGVNAPPIAYEVGGTEYIAVAAGGNALLGFPQGDGLMVFALPAR